MALADLFTFAQSGAGWIVVLLYVLYEVYAPQYLDRDTAFAPIVEEVPKKVDNLASEQEALRSDVDDIQKQNEVAMQVQRAQARASDGMDHEQVDDYLLENGVTPDTFLTDDVSGRYRADGGSESGDDEVTERDD